ncbi:MAG: protein kinase [Acidobacteriota bacterium]
MERVISHFRLMEKIGAGSFGEVCRAEDTALKRTVAIKILTDDLVRDPQARERFILEAHRAAALNHPHIATVYELGEADGHLFIAMECIEGQTLKQKIDCEELTLDAVIEAVGRERFKAATLNQAHSRCSEMMILPLAVTQRSVTGVMNQHTHACF